MYGHIVWRGKRKTTTVPLKKEGKALDYTDYINPEWDIHNELHIESIKIIFLHTYVYVYWNLLSEQFFYHKNTWEISKIAYKKLFQFKDLLNITDIH